MIASMTTADMTKSSPLYIGSNIAHNSDYNAEISTSLTTFYTSLHISAKEKDGRLFRQRYISFWEILADNLKIGIETASDSVDMMASGSNFEKKHQQLLTILRMVVEQLISLSSMSVACVRDAATEAVMMLGNRILGILPGLHEKANTSERQLKADAGKSGEKLLISIPFQ